MSSSHHPRRALWRPDLRALFAVEPNGGAHHVASRVLVSAGVPALTVFLLGHLEWLPYALLASVLSVYGRRAERSRRAVMQIEVGAILVALLVAGSALSAVGSGPAVVVLGAGLVAGLGTVVSDLRGWTPPGALFFVFAFATSASAPLGGDGLLPVAVVATLSAVFAVAVGWTMSRWDRLEASPRRPRPATRIVVAHGLVCAVGGAAAGWLAVLVGVDHPSWAVVSAIVPVVGVTTAGQLTRAAHRLAGTALGLVVSLVLFSVPMPPLVGLLVLVTLMALTELWIARNYSIALLFLTPFTIGASMIGGAADVVREVDSRGLATVIGVAVGAALILATHTVRHPRGRRDVALG